VSPLVLVLFLIGGGLLVVGAEALVRGASRLAATFGISPLVIGLTVVAFGTSAPELAVSISSAFGGSPDVAVGNAVGSNIFNVLVILGIAALIAPLVVSQRLVRIEVPLMIGTSLLLWALALDGRLGRIDGALLFAGMLLYTVWAIRKSRREGREVVEEYAAEFSEKDQAPATMVLDAGKVLGGLAMLVLGAHWFVNGATDFAEALGVSDLVIALTVVAAGTSMPELVTSAVASVRGERDIAVGNVVGSNLFNILSVLGLTALLDGGVPVANAALRFDIPIMVAVAVACLPIFFTGRLIARWEGLLFLAYWAAYTLYLILRATDHAALDTYTTAMIWFVLPLTVLTLAYLAWRAIRHERRLHPRT
jgi:cation:H+ antiporter